MTFRDALEREIAAQGLSIAEVAEKSNVSKGAIYNILNGKTEEDRIRPSTRRAIARGCNRELEGLEDGTVVFVDPQEAHIEALASEVSIDLLSGRPFLEGAFFKAPFDWLHELEEAGQLSDIHTVDRVFQRREDFLSVIVENHSEDVVDDLRFELKVVFTGGKPSGRFPYRMPLPLRAGERREETVFLLAGTGFELDLVGASYRDAEGQTRRLGGTHTYPYEGSRR